MATIEKSIVIEAPVRDVFAYLDEPVNLPEIWPSMVEVRNIETRPTGGHRFHWIYKMAGKRFEGDLDTVEFERDKHFVSKTTGDLPATFDYTFVPENGRTKVEVKTEYEIPKTLLGKLKEPFLRKLNEREAEVFLANLKDRLES
jgi:uncharacterized protein YndB with AHSA1/START domain